MANKTPILYTKDFYDEIFMKRLNNFTNYWKDKVDVTKIVLNEHKIHKERIINDYIIPISYLIYSFIYTKYSRFQFIKNLQIENNLNYTMYKEFFNNKQEYDFICLQEINIKQWDNISTNMALDNYNIDDMF
jgi:hypothetical protein